MIEQATFAGGCFWCTEAVFKRVKGVQKVRSGYSGGTQPNPTYEQVSSETTGHAEAIQIEFDPEIISYQLLCEIFLKTHDPTTKNQQGADRGTQYRSVIFYHSEQQKTIASETINKINHQKYYSKPIVTEVIEMTAFYPAEEYHQNFYENNKTYPYCTIVIDPKIKKLIANFNQNIV